MKQKMIQKITPILFEDSLLLSFSKDWIDIFGKIPEFDVQIDKNGRLVLRTKSVVQRGDFFEKW